MIYFSQLPSITGGKLLQVFKDQPVETLLTDSRKIALRAGTIFLAIKGDYHDGHTFIPQLYHQGIRQFMVEQGALISIDDYPEANIIEVKKTITALQQLVASHRSEYNIPIIGITGSNGKTIIKEWLSQLLAPRFQVVRSPKSYNSQLGVPLSVWAINDNHNIGVFEAGISRSGEMVNIEPVMKPTIGIFTNIGSAHDNGFENIKQKIQEKAYLFKDSNVIIYCRDHELIDEYLQTNVSKSQKLFTWSYSKPSDVVIQEIFEQNGINVIDLVFNDQRMMFRIPFNDKASFENIIHCICVCLYFNFKQSLIQEGISNLNQVSMRLALKKGIDGCYLIDDSYNNDLAGLKIALDFLMHQNQCERKSVIFSEIFEAGIEKETLYRTVADLIDSKSINKFIGIGTDLKQFQHFFKGDKKFYDDRDQLLDDLPNLDFKNEVILIKGARKFKLEAVVERLQNKIHGTVLEINLDAMTHNLNFFRNLLQPGVKLCVMVKAFAYGSGFLEIANLLQFHGVNYLGVAYPDEGIMLRQNGINLPIMVMNAAPESFAKLIEFNLEPEVYGLKMVEALDNHVKSYEMPVKIHIKIETGMHRLGFKFEDLPTLVSILKANDKIIVASIFSHLAGSEDEEHNAYSNQQFKAFEKAFTYLETALEHKLIKHILKTSGIVRFPDRQYDMVRLGIGLHGIGFNQEVQKELEPVATLKTTISQIDEVKSGSTIGYDRRGKADTDKKIATLAIGYADGFDRRFSNGKGKVWVNGKFAPVIGNVCMDMCMVDITGIDAEEGDQVVVFGEQLPLVEIANNIGTIPYEILTKVSDRVKRIFYME